MPELVPIRYGRMLVSPFTFYRGAAMIMAHDLAATPRSGLTVQCCGDAHLSNFGVFASPERRLVFDVNDFDETLPGPWEWDGKRLAVSMLIAARDNGYRAKDQERIVLDTVGRYRTAMAEFAGMKNLEVWYSCLDIESVIAELAPRFKQRIVKRSEGALAKLTGSVNGDVLGSTTRLVISTAASSRTGKARRRSSRSSRRAWPSTAACAAGRSPVRMLAAATGSRSPPTSAAATASTAHSSSSQSPTPSKTTATTETSRPQSSPARQRSNWPLAGTGTQAIVVAIAWVIHSSRTSSCRPGTRIHFALGLGVDRDDVV